MDKQLRPAALRRWTFFPCPNPDAGLTNLCLQQGPTIDYHVTTASECVMRITENKHGYKQQKLSVYIPLEWHV